ncbi:23S rRNA (adenine(2503)-C(2))-methyltransferase RlmN [Sulfuriroseicoccus oceanibius]|uniref:Probable dual-specificity RNA methyltransferase RlmN n=1 Tax=Sulfuriroseicoccus oceanibius TaxID=2707525 RepID=A0A6B3LD75_9BACT|nr:23S rRNA (adenine(2503)-C(2))-methyltransferase RlmN [Sulfuriroseicoccus oceanibius]QQL45187.1 23S rRNA (adenine(2503)-C(2))-methyltransferase RlmN [Sulfuriroseicoccus oceanibius]
MTDKRPALCGLTRDELTAKLKEAGQPAYRAGQVLDWIYNKRVTSIDDMTNLPAPLRETLKENFVVSHADVVTVQGAKDKTRKILYRLNDGRFVESVLIPASPSLYGDRADRRTICVSSQVGCAYGCKFCASGLAGFTRNLDSGEIVSQLLATEAHTGEKINNIVFMGMGEPLANFKNLSKALEIINSHWGLNIGARHITVSTSGVAPVIKKLADIPIPVRLAISLHGATDEVRDRIMPVNSKWNIDALFESLEYWRSKKKQKITFEFILIDGINDSMDQAVELAKRAKQLDAKVNLIPYNTVDGLTWKRPSNNRCQTFRKMLATHGVPATLRLEKGHDIDAACGQLRLKEEEKHGISDKPAAQ